MQQHDLEGGGQDAERPHQLQHTGIETAPAMRRMLGQIHRHPADLAAHREALQQAQQQQQQRRQHADLGVGRQQTDQKCGHTHQRDGDQKDGATPVAVCQCAKQGGTQWPHHHANAKGSQTQQQRGSRIFRREEQHTEIGGQRGKGEKIVPFEEGAKAGGEYNFALGGGNFVHWRVL